MTGIYAALWSAFFLGLAPIFGRQAILLGMTPFAVVAIRTTLAALLLFVVILIFYRPFLYIYPAGLLGCVFAGWINGLGSLFYYSALGRIDAGLGQLLYSLYPLFLVMWLTLDKQPPTRLTVVRLGLALPAVLLLVRVSQGQTIDLVGVILMMVASALYALHLPFNQRVLFDMPAPTVTLYTLISMSSIVVPVYLFTYYFDIPMKDIQNILGQLPSKISSSHINHYWWPVIGLTLVTFLSRLTLFFGVKHLGGMQTALIGLGELLVTLYFAHWILGESFTFHQWLGACLLVLSLALVGFEKPPGKRQGAGGFLSWIGSSHLTTEGWQPND